jgi:hypothetical protein
VIPVTVLNDGGATIVIPCCPGRGAAVTGVVVVGVVPVIVGDVDCGTDTSDKLVPAGIGSGVNKIPERMGLYVVKTTNRIRISPNIATVFCC